VKTSQDELISACDEQSLQAAQGPKRSIVKVYRINIGGYALRRFLKNGRMGLDFMNCYLDVDLLQLRQF
jgi:hypothetical protein